MKKIRFFGQNTQETCGISCILMILDYYKIKEDDGKHYSSQGKELLFYRRYGAHSTAGTLATGIARALSLRRLSVIIYHSSGQLLGDGEGFPEETRRKMRMEEWKHIKSANGRFKTITGAEITGERLREELLRDHLIVLQCMTREEYSLGKKTERVPHWVLLHDYEDERFIGWDPTDHRIIWTEEELKERIDTPFGRTYLAVSREKMRNGQ